MMAVGRAVLRLEQMIVHQKRGAGAQALQQQVQLGTALAAAAVFFSARITCWMTVRALPFALMRR